MKRKTRDMLFGRPERRYSTDVKIAQNLFNRAEDNLAFREGSASSSILDGAGGVFAAGAAGASYVGDRTAAAYESAWEHGENFNEWAQGLSDSETGLYPYTRDDKVS